MECELIRRKDRSELAPTLHCTRRDDACRYDSDPVKTSGQRLVGMMSEHLRFGRTPLWAVSTDAEERKRRRLTKSAKSYVQVGLRCAPRLTRPPV